MKKLGRVLGSLLAMVLTMASLQVMAETKAVGRDFNHNSTGFTLTGGHAIAACETCHAGGIFKGTPKNCDGCHALGKRVVATPKSIKHLVTDAPCESCHFNTSTFLGAKYNHTAAIPGQCANCHNNRIARGKTASHGSGVKAMYSCDKCHRTYAFLPPGWNHNGVAPGTCTTCHNGSSAIGLQGAASQGTPHTTVAKATYQCDECHNFFGWIPARYKHNIPGACDSCHNGTVAIGKPASHAPPAIRGINPCEDCHQVMGWLPARFAHNTGAACSSCHDGIKAVGKIAGHPGTTDECNQCHMNTVSWLPALGAKPTNHIPYNNGTSCSSCHTGTSGQATNGPTLHAYVSTYNCTECHLKGGTSYLGRMDKKSVGHEGWNGSGDCSQSGCHQPAGRRGVAYINWD